MELPITSVFIDSGYITDEVYRFVSGRRARNVYPCKGRQAEGLPVVARVHKIDKPFRCSLVTVGVDEAKGIVYDRLRIAEPGPGYCHFPQQYPLSYFKMLCAERIELSKIKSTEKKRWVKIEDRNEALDIRVYALAALRFMNVNFESLIKSLTSKDEETTIEKSAKRTPKRKATRRVPGGYDPTSW